MGFSFGETLLNRVQVTCEHCTEAIYSWFNTEKPRNPIYILCNESCLFGAQSGVLKELLLSHFIWKTLNPFPKQLCIEWIVHESFGQCSKQDRELRLH